jgi:conjugal transfer mating pair stabilization protein TraG
MWEVYAYHNSESLFGIFNAVAAIMSSGTYAGAIAAVAFCGFIAAMVAYMFAPEKLQGWKWLATVVLAYGVLFVPRVTVGIVDKTGGTAVHVVDNVPFGMAALGGLTSTIGYSITELFETAFQVIPGPGALPAELAYQRHGLMFGSRIIQETRRAAFPDPATRVDVMNFISNCTAYDISDGTISATDFSTSRDLWALLAATNPARFTTLTTAAGVTTDTCTAVYAALNGRMAPQVTALTARLALKLNPTLLPAAANAAFLNQVTQAFIRSQIADASSGAADLVRQNALINAVNDAGEMGCQKINDPACMMLATGRASAVASQNAAWINGAKIAEQALPIVRNVAEATCYAVFPLLVLLLFLSSGRTTMLMVGGYAAALISIQLWPPLFAVLNYMASIYSQIDQAAAAEVGGGVKALSLQSASPIYSNAISSQAVVSYLIVGIPMLAYSLANRLVNWGSALVGGLTGLQSTIGNASSAAAVGNSSIGNVSMDQRNVSPSTSNPFVSRAQDAAGNWTTSTGTGQQAVELLRNIGPMSNIVTTRVSQGAVSEASRSAEAARNDAVSANQERSAALVEVVTKATSASAGTRSSSGQSSSSFEELGQSADRLSVLSQQVAKTTGLSSAQVQQIAFQLAGGVGTPGKLPIRIGANGSMGKTYSSNLTEAEQKVSSALSAEQLREFKQFGDRASRDTSFLSAVSTESREGKELASRLSMSTVRAESAQATYAQRVALAERLSTAHESGQAISVDLAQLPMNSDIMRRYQQLAAEYGPNSQALQVAMSGELASYALSPTRYYADGAMAPMTMGQIRDRHLQDVNDPVFDPAKVSGADQANNRSTGAPSLARPHADPALSQSPEVRSSVEEQGRLQNEAEARVQTFDERNQVTRHADGTVGSKRSQLGENTRQLRNDVMNMAASAADGLVGSSSQALDDAKTKAAAAAGSARTQAIDATSEVPNMLPRAGRRKRP